MKLTWTTERKWLCGFAAAAVIWGIIIFYQSFYPPLMSSLEPWQEMTQEALPQITVTTSDDDITIHNGSGYYVGRVSGTCMVDGQEHVIDWVAPEDSEALPPISSYDVIRIGFAASSWHDYTGDDYWMYHQKDELRDQEIIWLLHHHKVTDCSVKNIKLIFQ